MKISKPILRVLVPGISGFSVFVILALGRNPRRINNY